MTPPLLRFAPDPADEAAVVVDLDVLIQSRLLIQANSGGGKSYALRYLLEQTFGALPHLVLDPEGEFATLRDRFPYLLVGKEGADIPVAVETAGVLARRLVELGASAVIDLFELPKPQRQMFVRDFLDTLINLPRSLWRPTMVVLDEAHVFCPEDGASVARDAVVALCSLGRKRGYAAVLATQRIAKLAKDAAAEQLNKLVGRTSLDLDLRRAGDELEMDKAARGALRHLAPGTFFAFGPAISTEVVQVRTGAVATHHPQGGAVAPLPPAPPEALRALIAQLQDLPVAASAAARALDAARQHIAELERQLAARPKAAPAEKPRPVVKEVPVVTPAQLDQLQTQVDALNGTVSELRAALLRVTPPQVAPPAAPAPRAANGVEDAPKPMVILVADALAIPAIAGKVAQARQLLRDRSAAGYVDLVMRLLWGQALRPEDLAEGRGSGSKRTITRMRQAVEALLHVRLLRDAGRGRVQVDQDEIARLRGLAQRVGGR